MYVYAWHVFLKSTSAEALAVGFCYRLCVSRLPRVLISNLATRVAYGVERPTWSNTADVQWSVPVFRMVQ